MSVSAITALTLLVLVAAGFYLGRTRALAVSSGKPASLHSLPNYYGYYLAAWTGIPALILLALYGIMGDRMVDGLAVARLDQAAAPLVSELDAATSRDSAYQTAARDLADLETAAADMQARLETARADDAPSAQIDDLVAERQTVRDLARDAGAQMRARRESLALDVLSRARSEPTNPLTLAGFEYVIAPPERRSLFLADARSLAFGRQASRVTPELEATAQVIAPYDNLARFGSAGVGIALALIGLTFARRRINPGFRARNHVERLIGMLLLGSSILAILTTVGIVLSLLFESLRFFEAIGWRIHEFLFGLQWSPQIAIRADQVGQTGAFGAVPLFAGTAMITLIAMLIAAPVGLFAAIYLSEYAGPTTRRVVKPVLEILAGIPTVVYGFFALLTVGPAIRAAATFIGVDGAVTQSALSAGLVMGVMIIPFVSSLSDDVINAVPQSLRDGAYAMGATKSETVRQVILPAALPGIVGALLLAVSRAVGETMIVVMAAGQGANLTANPFESVTTITVQIVMLLTGDQEFDSPKTLSAFALGLVLFMFTLALNVIALRVVQKYREKYD